MDDMNDFDRQLASVVLRRVGPSEPVDDAAIFTTITATQSPRWRFPSVFSAAKFVVAAAIVALFGGFLLAGVLTAPQDDVMAPAAATESPSLMTTDELLAGMVTEEVEPGVLRVVNDGVRSITSPESDFQSSGVALAPDGSVWLSGQRTMYRLGDEATFQVPDDIWWPYREVGPDGSLWAIALDYVQSFDGHTWTKRTGPTGNDLRLGSLAIGPDGTVWVAATDSDKYCPDIDFADCIGTDLMRLEGDGSLTTIEGWADVYEGDVASDELAVSPDGDVWLIGMVRWDGPEAEALLRFDGSEWEVIPGPEMFLNHPFGNSLDIGPDGTLWVNAGNGYSGAQGVGGLARFDDPGWTTFSEADGVQDWGGQGFIATDLLKVAPDGSLWMNGARDGNGCDGVDHYDGSTWTSYLRDSCVHDLSIAPDGSVWLRAGADDRVQTYVIRPEAGATSDSSLFGVVARDPIPDPMAPSFFSGTVRSDETFASEGVAPVAEPRSDGVVEFRGESSTFALDANDPRISGMVTIITNETDYREGAPTLVTTGLVGTVRAGVMRIVNDEGSWEGEYTNLQFGEANQPGYLDFENSAGWLTGSGAYEGLSAYFVWPFFERTFSGHITAEGPPPAPEMPPNQ